MNALRHSHPTNPRILNYIKETPDYLLTDVWPAPPEQYKYRQLVRRSGLRKEARGCCTIT